MVISAPVSARRRRSQSVSAGQPEALVERGGVQRLADVPQVGQLPLAVDPAEHPGRQSLLGAGHLQQRGDAAGGEHRRPSG